MNSFSEEVLKETIFLKGKDQQKKLRKLPSAFSKNEIILRDIILLSTDQYSFSQVQVLFERNKNKIQMFH